MKTTRYFDRDAPPFGSLKPDWMVRTLRWLLVSGLIPALFRPPVERTIGGLFKRAKLQVFDVTWRGINLRLVPRQSVHDRVLMYSGQQYDEEYFNFFDPLKCSRAVFIDVGANSGIYSLFCASITKPESVIIAIEPGIDAFQRLNFHVEMNKLAKRVNLEKVAVNDTSGIVAMSSRDATNDGVLRIVEPAISREDQTKNGLQKVEVIESPSKTLLELVEKYAIDCIDFIKVDVEGYEDRVLGPFFKSADKALWPKHILMEVSGRQEWREDILAELIGYGYEVRFDNDLDVLLQLNYLNPP